MALHSDIVYPVIAGKPCTIHRRVPRPYYFFGVGKNKYVS